MKVLYDPKCEELARHFLDDEASAPSEDEVQELAGLLQGCIEDYLSGRAHK